MQARTFVWVLGITLIVLSPTAIASGPWSKGRICDTQKNFEDLIRARMPRRCELQKSAPAPERICMDPNADAAFGYYDAYTNDEGSERLVVYELQVRTTPPCLIELRDILSSDDRLSVAGRQPIRISAYPNADGGPTLLFSFKAQDSDLEDITNRRSGN